MDMAIYNLPMDQMRLGGVIRAGETVMPPSCEMTPIYVGADAGMVESAGRPPYIAT